jgi:hypothetical protein
MTTLSKGKLFVKYLADLMNRVAVAVRRGIVILLAVVGTLTLAVLAVRLAGIAILAAVVPLGAVAIVLLVAGILVLLLAVRIGKFLNKENT